MPTFDAVSSAINQTTTTPSWSHTCTGTNLLLVVTVGWRHQDPGNAITGITYNSVALTQLGTTSNGEFATAEIWYLLAPATGTHTVAATFTDLARAHLGAVSYTAVNQSTPLGTYASNTGTSTAPSVTVTSATGDVVIAVGAERGTETFTTGASQTMRWEADAASNVSAQCDDEAGAASVVMDWSTDDSQEWVAVGVSIQALAAAGHMSSKVNSAFLKSKLQGLVY